MRRWGKWSAAANEELAASVVSLELDDGRGDRPQVADQVSEPFGRGQVAVGAGAVVSERGVTAHDPVEVLAGREGVYSDEC